MGFGFSKIFVIVLLFSAAWAYYMRDWKAALTILIPFAIIRFIWKLLTK